MYLPGLWPGIPLSGGGGIYLGCGLGFLCLRGVFTWAVAWDSSVRGVYLPGLWPGIPLSGGRVFTWAVAWDSSV